MPKYYVKCGELMGMVIAPHEKEAALVVLKRHQDDIPAPKLGAEAYISERSYRAFDEEGFNAPDIGDEWYCTKLLQEILRDAD